MRAVGGPTTILGGRGLAGNIEKSEPASGGENRPKDLEEVDSEREPVQAVSRDGMKCGTNTT